MRKRRLKEKRIYELSQVDDKKIPTEPGYQIPFRHLCNYLQIFSGDIDKVFSRLGSMTDSQKERLKVRLKCAKNWLEMYAPEDFKFSLQSNDSERVVLNDNERKAVKDFALYVKENLDDMAEKEFSNYIYKAAEDNGLESADFFRVVYLVLIGKEKGPKLASFVKACGSETILPILERY